ncbi:MAG: type II toxin-antitoxin system VapC family toxin [Candidatus Korobacteraceae bacterium]
MTTAIDTNVIIALWDREISVRTRAQAALDLALDSGSLVVAAPVFAELMAAPGRNEKFLESFFADTGIAIDWMLDEAVWRAAGEAFRTYASRRRKQGDLGPRRILADFVIGAHAFISGYLLLTFDTKLYSAAFPGLRLAPL